MRHRTFEEVRDSMHGALAGEAFGRDLVRDFDRYAIALDHAANDDGCKLVRRRSIAEADAEQGELIVFMSDGARTDPDYDDQSAAYLDEFHSETFGEAMTMCVADAECRDLWFGLKALIEWHRLRRLAGFNELVDDFAAKLKTAREHGANKAVISELRKGSIRARQLYQFETGQFVNELAYRVLRQRIFGEKFRLRFPREITLRQALRYITVEFVEAIETNLPKSLSAREDRTRLHVIAAAVHGAMADHKLRVPDASLS